MKKKLLSLLMCIVICNFFPLPVFGKPVKNDTYIYENFVEGHLSNAIKQKEINDNKSITVEIQKEKTYRHSVIDEESSYEEQDQLYFQGTENYTYENNDSEFYYLCQMVRIECGEGEGEDYYNECYLQTAVALNRVLQGWGETLMDVLMAPGQFYGWGYDTWDWNSINIDIPDLQRAVANCMAYNNTPNNLVFADSRHNHEGTESMDFYLEIRGQDFYLAK